MSLNTISPEAVTKLPEIWGICLYSTFPQWFSSVLVSRPHYPFKINEDLKSFCLCGLFWYLLYSELKLKSSKITGSLHVNKSNICMKNNYTLQNFNEKNGILFLQICLCLSWEKTALFSFASAFPSVAMYWFAWSTWRKSSHTQLCM